MSDGRGRLKPTLRTNLPGLRGHAKSGVLTEWVGSAHARFLGDVEGLDGPIPGLSGPAFELTWQQYLSWGHFSQGNHSKKSYFIHLTEGVHMDDIDLVLPFSQ